ncbi:DNA replication/repair protein RecF [Parvicella tangerina]|uniref:DNA replication and repair protein RecF n=1 Tax=Parvicella tangerina TaxID=2829795 RepID=A0A916JJ18_9FLAO|nr:DNA replication/repair protein RecF [Parvicella tangerina]CAG5076428.1 DNA replication and repair protein RecF [Parvicella tangerina]
MHLKSLSLINFKNISEAEFEFSADVNCFLGLNGEGKTNILDGIHYLSLTKSYFNHRDNQNIKFEEPFFVVQGVFQKDEDELNIYCGMKAGEKKTFKKNKKNYTKLADHVGLLPVVMISPNDTSLILDGSEVRRKFIDSIISQFDKEYLQKLMAYNKVLQQRNALLKQFAERGAFQEDMLEVMDMQIGPLGDWVHTRRQEFLDEFIPVFNQFYGDLSNGKEEVSLVYQSQLTEGSLESLLVANRMKDRSANYTTQGIHKDDLVFTIKDHPLKKFGSQGQQKSYLIALKLATHAYTKEKKGFAPILLLDDIFDKLDDTRIDYLLGMIKEGKLGQTFITDTSTEKVPSILKRLDINFNAFEIENGAIKNQLA